MTAFLVALIAAILLAASGGCGTDTGVAELSGPTMGTRFSVQFSPPPSTANLDHLQRLIRQRLQVINGMLSTYETDSDLQRFNRSRSLDWQPVPAALAALVARAQVIARLSDGRYDVTVGPLVNLWGFGNAGDRDSPPEADEIAALLPHVGYRLLSVRQSPPALRKAAPRLEVDLSSIAKGWAVDQLAGLLEAEGITSYLVEIGGETRASGRKADGSPWRIAIEQPDTARAGIAALVALDGRALATSGDYRNFFEHRGERFSHTLDPTTGDVVRHRLASVSVLADNCADADAWATALLALGDTDGPRLAAEAGLAALFLVRDGTGLRTRASRAWPAATAVTLPSAR